MALPVVCSGAAYAETGKGELPVVNRPDHPAAEYAPGAERLAHAEPLNASVDCELPGRRSA